jgi:hypothetical protein
MPKLAAGPASETADSAARERIAPWSIHTAPPGSGMPPISSRSIGSTKERTGSV